MLKYRLLRETDVDVTYEYFPEADGLSGVVQYDKRLDEFVSVNLAENDRHQFYVIHLFRKIREFANDGVFKETGTIAWY